MNELLLFSFPKSYQVVQLVVIQFFLFFVVMIAIIILHVVFGMSLSQDTPSCNCKNDFEMAFCYNVRACPEFVTIARVECAIKEIIVKPNTSLDQVLIHGQCTNISAYKRFCMQAIKEIKMQATSESFLCAGNSILFIS